MDDQNLPDPVFTELISQRYRFTFTGTAGEYFRIWIVNTFLTIITFGIYAPWAKVRTRQYFYKNTFLDSHSFDYLANPLAIFKGYMIIGTAFLLYMLSNLFMTRLSIFIVLLFYLSLPFLIYKSFRFYANNSAYRNVRFRFLGTLNESYKVHLFMAVLIPFTLGLIIPYWIYSKKKYFFDNFAFGTTKNSFSGEPKPFYKIYGAALIIFIVMIFLSIAGLSVLMVPFIKTGEGANKEALFKMMLPMIVLGYFFFFIISILIQQALFAWQTNYCWKNNQLGSISFESTLKAGRLIWLRLSNIAAIIFSFGLLIPWAKIRRARYMLDNLSVVTEGNLDGFISAVETDESAIGDTATDFFDLEIGL